MADRVDESPSRGVQPQRENRLCAPCPSKGLRLLNQRKEQTERKAHEQGQQLGRLLRECAVGLQKSMRSWVADRHLAWIAVGACVLVLGFTAVDTSHLWTLETLALCLAVPCAAIYGLARGAVRREGARLLATLHGVFATLRGRRDHGVSDDYGAVEAMPVGYMALPLGLVRCGHPQAHARPTPSDCISCHASGRDHMDACGITCFSVDHGWSANASDYPCALAAAAVDSTATSCARSGNSDKAASVQAVYAVGITKCDVCGHVGPGVWYRRAGDDRWSDASELISPSGPALDPDIEVEAPLHAVRVCHLYVRTIGSLVSVPDHAQHEGVQCVLRYPVRSGENAQPIVLWLAHTRKTHWLRAYI